MSRSIPDSRTLVAALLLALAAPGLAAAPANAAVDPVCDRTFVGGEDTVGEMNAELLSLAAGATTPTYCFTGTFELDAPLDVLGSVTLRAEGDAEFVVSGASAVTTASTEQDVLLTIEGLTIRAAEDRPTGESLVDGRSGLTPTSTDITLRDVTISGGDAEFGGAVLGTSILIVDSLLEGNSATTGGAAHALGILVVVDSEFTGNSAVNAGALFAGGSLTLSSSTLEGNTATGLGGAVFSRGIADIENSTFVGNTAGDEGGALYLFGGRTRFSTFLDNAAPAPVEGEELPGDAIYLDSTGGSDLRLSGSIFAGSTGHPQLGVGGAATGAFVDAGGNLFTTAAIDERDLPLPADSSVFELTTLEIFGAAPVLADNGGPTRTLALLVDALAVDAAGTQEQVRGPDIDQRGLARGELRDAGAVELQPGEGEAPPGGGEEPPAGGGVEPPADGGGGESPRAPAPQPELAESGAADLSAVALAAMLLALLGGLALLRARRA